MSTEQEQKQAGREKMATSQAATGAEKGVARGKISLKKKTPAQPLQPAQSSLAAEKQPIAKVDVQPQEQSPPSPVKTPAEKSIEKPLSTGKKDGTEGMFMRIAPRDHDLITDIRATILTQSPRGGRLIIWFTLVFVVAFFVWAAYSELEEVTRGSGKVVPSSQIQVVQNLEGGILSQLNVHVGDVVEKNQILLKIDKTRFTASYNESRASFLALTAKVARLEAEVQEKQFVVPEVVQKENAQIGSRETQLYNSRMKSLDNAQQILKEQLSQRKQELSELQAKLGELNRTNQLLKKEIGITRPLVAQGAVSKVDMLRLERQASEMKGNIQATQLSIPRVRSQLKEAQNAIEDEKLKYINDAREELNKAYTDLESISASSVALEDRLQRTEVRSPVKGTVNRILVNTVGGIIQPGMDLIEIVPLEDSLLIEARIKPSDIAFIRPDQKAMIKFSAYDFTIYGGLEAKLEQISADSLTDERGNDYYLVRLRTGKNYLGGESNPMPIIPGMVVTADIISGKKTVLSYLLKPMLRAKYLALRER